MRVFESSGIVDIHSDDLYIQNITQYGCMGISYHYIRLKNQPLKQMINIPSDLK